MNIDYSPDRDEYENKLMMNALKKVYVRFNCTVAIDCPREGNKFKLMFDGQERLIDTEQFVFDIFYSEGNNVINIVNEGWSKIVLSQIGKLKIEYGK